MYNQKSKMPSFEVMSRRFFREIQQSRLLSEVKKRRFRSKDPSRRLLREAARRKTAIRTLKRGY